MMTNMNQYEELLKIEDERRRELDNEMELLKQATSSLSVDSGQHKAMVECADGCVSHSKATNDKYDYQEENYFLQHDDPMSEGDTLMTNGDLGAAILAYEAAVQKNPQDSKVWFCLGFVLCDNEQDNKAIAAFNSGLKVEPNHQEALLALSVSLANESMENYAVIPLEKWITVYEGSQANEIQRTPSNNSVFDLNSFKMVEDRYLAAARKQQETPDASLQNALGVLYNLNRNFERAVDCLQLAIASRPDDARLWNRLGATLANWEHIDEALVVYRKAILLCPTYVRAICNQGISCLHLKKYREATDYFLLALELQKSDEGTLWLYLRSATIRMRGCNMELSTGQKGSKLIQGDIKGIYQMIAIPLLNVYSKTIKSIL